MKKKNLIRRKRRRPSSLSSQIERFGHICAEIGDDVPAMKAIAKTLLRCAKKVDRLMK